MTTAVQVSEIHEHIPINFMKAIGTVYKREIESDPGEIVIAFEVIELVIETVDHGTGCLFEALAFFLSVHIELFRFSSDLAFHLPDSCFRNIDPVVKVREAQEFERLSRLADMILIHVQLKLLG